MSSRISVLTGAWAALLSLPAGGIDLSIGALEISANDPYRPLFVTSIALTVYILAGGAMPSPSRFQKGWADAVARKSGVIGFLASSERIAWILTVAVMVIGWVYGSKAVGAADSYGYLSQSDLWVEGSLRVHQPIVGVVPWSNAEWTFAPVGSYRPMGAFRPVEGEDNLRMVPVYPPGLPLLMAGLGLIGGFQAKFLVFPLFGGLAVLATYYIGVRLAGKTAALVGTWLLATSPPLLFMLMSTMSDAVVSGLWAMAFMLSLGAGAWRAIGAGLFMSATLLTRPNLAPLVVIVGSVYLARLLNPETRSRAFRDCVFYGIAALIGVVTLALTNHYFYGSPTGSGYGNMDALFSPRYVPTNIRLYLSWLVEVHTPLGLIGLAAAVLPVRSLWPAAADEWPLRVAMALSVVSVWATYFLYLPWDAWWYLRFLLPTFPFIMLGIGAIYAKVVGSSRREAQMIGAVLIVGLGLLQLEITNDRGAFTMWSNERRYVAGARMTNAETDRNSLIFTGVHVGSVRYYGSRMSVYVESFPPRQLDSSLRWLARHGVRPYLLVEEWEVPIVRERFAGQKALDVLTGPPIAMLQAPAKLMLYDLLERQPDSLRPSIWTGVDASVWAAPRAPAPRLEIRE